MLTYQSDAKNRLGAALPVLIRLLGVGISLSVFATATQVLPVGTDLTALLLLQSLITVAKPLGLWGLENQLLAPRGSKESFVMTVVVYWSIAMILVVLASSVFTLDRDQSSLIPWALILLFSSLIYLVTTILKAKKFEIAAYSIDIIITPIIIGSGIFLIASGLPFELVLWRLAVLALFLFVVCVLIFFSKIRSLIFYVEFYELGADLRANCNLQALNILGLLGSYFLYRGGTIYFGLSNEHEYVVIYEFCLRIALVFSLLQQTFNHFELPRLTEERLRLSRVVSIQSLLLPTVAALAFLCFVLFFFNEITLFFSIASFSKTILILLLIPYISAFLFRRSAIFLIYIRKEVLFSKIGFLVPFIGCVILLILHAFGKGLSENIFGFSVLVIFLALTREALGIFLLSRLLGKTQYESEMLNNEGTE